MTPKAPAICPSNRAIMQTKHELNVQHKDAKLRFFWKTVKQQN